MADNSPVSLREILERLYRVAATTEEHNDSDTFKFDGVDEAERSVNAWHEQEIAEAVDAAAEVVKSSKRSIWDEAYKLGIKDTEERLALLTKAPSQSEKLYLPETKDIPPEFAKIARDNMKDLLWKEPPEETKAPSQLDKEHKEE